ncbi:hypothetical protein MBLNU457_2064t1 [Dothideomycetes sp. NU457]
MTQTRSRANQRRDRERVDADGVDTENTPKVAPSLFQGLVQRYNYNGHTGRPSNGHGDAGSPSRSSSRTGIKRNLTEDTEKTTSSSNSIATRSPAKRKRESSKYAPPSKYAHLAPLVDILEPNLICVFVGTNPGVRTATSGHAYAHPSNLFWKLLHSSGCTDRRCRPEEDVDLPKLYSMGNTNIVERPTKDAGELSKAEMAEGTPILEAKFRKHRPEAVCIVGKGIWEAIWRYRHGKNPSKDEFHWGWQDESENMGKTEPKNNDAAEDWNGAKVYVTSSTSGLSASLRPPEKEAIWKPFGEWVMARRKERQSQTTPASP